ncbi:Symplekin tight junction protein C terminal-domain-containing protein [Suillus fuscotomentosus]|uniref:Symplekin tight junction protein C terminal-domain-containing protein n=1 Tax=Suillus fuscotomentosus TaxID=1912939 RepID=A0AAD4EKL1_9AGAM|nr:Symplekin tight junction protein C terminal-domain-containing protein [Suillus fuscotomentosus]KAG1907771.1 Symplekin tight junction protein C terminal-domain-containing protein [Suillus fuscotomentosus]
MAGNPVDPLQTLSAALAVPADSKEQADILATLRESLEAHPNPITHPLAGDSLLKRWVLDLLHFAISRSNLSNEVRTQLSVAGVNKKSDITSCDRCTNRTLRQQWDVLSQCKARILEFIWSPTASTGVKVSAVKFMQRVIIVQTRGISDPRLQNKNDPNISNVPVDHPFLPGPTLEAEGMKLLESVITMLYTSQNPELLSAILHSWSNLVKQRPALVQLVVSSLSSWTPAALSGLPAQSVKSVEKAVRILLIHISRGPHGSSFGAQINEALSLQVARMERASTEEKARKKRPSSTPAEHPSDAKPFTEPALLELVQTYRQSRGLAPGPPVSSTPQPAPPTPEATPTPGPSAEPTVKDEPVDPLQMDMDEEEMEYEPDRLNMELSGDETVAEEETIPADLPEALTIDLTDSTLLGPKELTDIERNALMRGSVGRIWDGAEELKVDSAVTSQWPGTSPTDMWMLLIVRMVTRVAHLDGDPSSASEDGGDGETKVDFYSRQDNLRQTLCDYIMADFPSRLRLVTTWMNEEWYNDRIRMTDDPHWRPNYELWLNQVVSTYQTVLEGKPEGKPDGRDKAFARFLLDLPSVPPDVLGLLRDLSVDPDKMHVGFTSLREFVLERPSLRAEALQVLLELTTHPDPVTRRAAINTVRRWVPGIEPMDSMIRDFALQILRRLQKRPPKEAPRVIDEQAGAGDENMEDGQLPSEDLLQTPYLQEEIELPARKAHVLQHVELLFALSVKIPEFLDEIFTAYGQMELTVQEAIQDLITALIKSLGSSNGKLLTLMRTCPPGSESLALRVLTIFTEHGRPSAQLVALVKGLISDRDLDARFLIPIIAEMDKPDILKYLPRIVSILNGQQEPKNLVRSVFSSVVTTPPQTFGSVSSNLPRVRQSELLTPAELMVLLHEAEKEIGLKSAIEAIGVCFSMTDVFRSEILAVVMQQIVDEPVLPVLFLRTVIQAVTTYRTLVGFVSTTLLSRLITKKIWQNPHLWEGFIRCAKVIAPASFGALLQLPKEQLRELVDKQPSLKSGLREYVTKRAGNKARVAGFLDIFGEDDDASPVAPATPDVVMSSVPA